MFGLTIDSLPSFLTTGGEGAFNNCKYLELLSLPRGGITVLEDNLFAGSTYLPLINITEWINGNWSWRFLLMSKYSN